MTTTTNKKFIDTNPEVPRVIHRGQTQITLTGPGSSQGSVSVTVSHLPASNNNVVDAYFHEEESELLQKMPWFMRSSSDSIGITDVAWFSTSSNNGKLKIDFNLFRQTNIVGDVNWNFYYVVYSTPITIGQVL